ncbi:Protein YLS9 [Morella rubra]|uniref:Protein YLS9 n=1 Tax=Morella rubra TaxID=262757 RepID=A0A6A1WBD8_9ROSI|nr:Protein YLS9 [Morella rubra]
MAEKQSHLNGAFYGPSIPPPRRAYNRPSRGSGGCGCCGCLFGCLCDCIFGLIFKLVFTVLIIIGLAALVVWLVLRPNNLKFNVTDASLTQFNLDSNNTLQYNLALNITVRNPNKRIGIYYDTIQANAYYEDQRFNTVTLTPFYQGHKNTSVLTPAFDGQQLVLLGTSELSTFNSEKSNGIYSIDVKLNLRIRTKMGLIKIGHFKPKINCDLKVPLSSSGTSTGSFETTKCVLRPNNLKFNVTDASLTQFNLDSNNTLQYNLALNITVRNPNKRIGIYYDTIQANAYYEDQRFNTVTLTPFYQGHKNTSVLTPAFDGQQLVLLGTSELSTFNSEKSNGIYSIDVKLNLRIRTKMGLIKIGHFKPKINCDLKVPLSSSGTSTGSFETTKCGLDL